MARMRLRLGLCYRKEHYHECVDKQQQERQEQVAHAVHSLVLVQGLPRKSSKAMRVACNRSTWI